MRNSGFQWVVKEIEYLCAKRTQTSFDNPRLVVVHGEHQPLTKCMPGETVEQIGLAFRSRVIPLSLSPTGLVVADVLARKRPMLLTAAHIERILLSDPFCVRLGAYASPAPRCRVRVGRKLIKVYVQRIRRQLSKALKDTGIARLPEDILVSESTDLSNVMTYRFAIPCEFVHLNAGFKAIPILAVESD